MNKRKAIDALGMGPDVSPDGVGVRFYIFNLDSNNHMYCATRLFITDFRPRDFALGRYSSVCRYCTALSSNAKTESERLPR
jgi:hypothetical protein